MAELDIEHLQTRAAATAALQLGMAILASLRRTGVYDAHLAGAVTDAAISTLELQPDTPDNQMARRLIESVAEAVANVGRAS